VKGPLGRARPRFEDNSNIDIKEIVSEDMDLTNVGASGELLL
jgi:hypothetical protein